MIISGIYDIGQRLYDSIINLQSDLIANPRLYPNLTNGNLKILTVINNQYSIADMPTPIVMINPGNYSLSPYGNMNMSLGIEYELTVIYENRKTEQAEQYLRALTDEIVNWINGDKIVRGICANMNMNVNFDWNDDNNQIRLSKIRLSFTTINNQYA